MELEERKLKQAIDIRTRKEVCKELAVTEKDHEECRQHGFPAGALAKFLDTEQDMLHLFCRIG